MATGKSKTARRREVRRHVPRPGPRWLQAFRRREIGWALFYGAIFTLLASLIAISGRVSLHERPGRVVTSPVVSRLEFQAVDKDATQNRQEEARSREPAVFLPNEAYYKALSERFGALMALADFESIEQVKSDYREQVKLSAEGLSELHRFKSDDESLEQWRQLTDSFLQSLFDLAILSPDAYARKGDQRSGGITIVHPDPASPEQREQIRYPNAIYSVQDETAVAETLRREADDFPKPLRETVVAMVLQDLQPTYVSNQQARTLTDQRQQAAYEQAGDPPAMQRYPPGEVLVKPGTELSRDHIALLQAERKAFRAQQATTDRWLQRAGLAGLMLLIAVGLWTYIYHYSPRIVQNPMRGLALTGLLLLTQALAVGLTQLWPPALYLTAVFPTLLAAVILAITYDQRFALAIGAIHTVLVMTSLDLSPGFAVVLLTGVAVAAVQLREVRNRSKLVLVGLWTALALGVVTLLTGAAERPLYLSVVTQALGVDVIVASAAGLLTGLLVQGVLPAIERVFRVTTAMTLKELNDASHPLLQRLAQEAPGTYQHSLRIADMAEAAAEAIGADGLLCRVGAMYHDIGKINKPGYFIENQGGGPNRHGKLSPAMSLLIIVGHVKDGVEMAREYRIPPAVRSFIESHHGTTLVEYFYHAARKQKEAEAAPGPSEFEFRYPGPKPQTREAAILLLCDSIEAAARSLPEPTPVRLEQVVHNMATKRLMDGQFDECNLTLQELHKIEQAITKTLCAIYHARIKYPGDQEPRRDQPAPPDAEHQQPEPPRRQPAAS